MCVVYVCFIFAPFVSCFALFVPRLVGPKYTQPTKVDAALMKRTIQKLEEEDRG